MDMIADLQRINDALALCDAGQSDKRSVLEGSKLLGELCLTTAALGGRQFNKWEREALQTALDNLLTVYYGHLAAQEGVM